MDRILLNAIIEQIVAEVVQRIRLYERKLMEPEETVVLTASPVAFPKRLKSYLDEHYTDRYVVIHLGEGRPWENADCLLGRELGEASLTRRLYAAKRVLLACPTVALLREIGRGEDREDAARLFTKAILWGKQATVLLDYEPPRFHRNSFLGSLTDTLDALKDSGVEVTNYCVPTMDEHEALTLVTEETVQKAHAAGRPIYLAQKAIVTPAARDAAKALGVQMEYG